MLTHQGTKKLVTSVVHKPLLLEHEPCVLLDNFKLTGDVSCFKLNGMKQFKCSNNFTNVEFTIDHANDCLESSTN